MSQVQTPSQMFYNPAISQLYLSVAHIGPARPRIDCSSCHHDVDSANRERARGRGGPPPPTSCTVLSVPDSPGGFAAFPFACTVPYKALRTDGHFRRSQPGNVTLIDPIDGYSICRVIVSAVLSDEN